MKSLFTAVVIFCNLVSITSNAQYDTRHLQYDSLTNFLGDTFDLYKGQSLFFCPHATREKSIEWKLVKSPIVPSCEKTNIYCPNADSGASSWECLSIKIFYVNNLIIIGNETWMQLIENGKDTCYFRYRSSSQFYFPFIVSGYYHKMKTQYDGKIFYTRGNNAFPFIDYNSKKPINIPPNTLVTCRVIKTDYGIELLMYTDSISFSIIPDPKPSLSSYLISQEYAQALKKKYPPDHVNALIARQVMIGMTEEEVLLTLDSTNIKTNDGNSTKWEYDGNKGKTIVTFKNKKVTNVEYLKNNP